MDWNNINSLNEGEIWFKSITTLVYFTIGGFGNIVSIIIFNHKEFKKHSRISTVYLIAAYVMNILTIAYLPIIFLAKIWIINDLTCKLYSGTFTYLVEVHAWLTAINSLERVVATIKPNDFAFRKSSKFQMSLIIGFNLSIAVSILPTFLTTPTQFSVNNITLVTCDTSGNSAWVWIYFMVQYSLLRAIIPFIISFSNVLVIRKVIQMKKNSVDTDRKREISVFKALIVSDIFFLVFRIPMMLYLTLTNGVKSFDDIDYSIVLAISLIADVFNFVILLLTSKLYRKLFFQNMKFRIKFRFLFNQNRIQPVVPRLVQFAQQRQF